MPEWLVLSYDIPMTKYILIGGYIHEAPDGGASFCEELVKIVGDRPIRILDCLFARPQDVWNERFSDDKNFFLKHSSYFKLELASPERFLEQMKDSDILFFEGGIPRLLISTLDGVGDWYQYLDGKILVGSSGGAGAICKYYGVGKTMNIGEGLGLLPIKIIPHWKSESDYGRDKNIDWDSLLEKLKRYKEELKIVTIKEGEYTIIENEGNPPARIGGCD